MEVRHEQLRGGGDPQSPVIHINDVITHTVLILFLKHLELGISSSAAQLETEISSLPVE
jgi:hypothetical protein